MLGTVGGDGVLGMVGSGGLGTVGGGVDEIWSAVYLGVCPS